jgi:hypothetical protein
MVWRKSNKCDAFTPTQGTKRRATGDDVYAETVFLPSVWSHVEGSVKLEPHKSAATQDGSRSVPTTQPLSLFHHQVATSAMLLLAALLLTV